MKLWFLPLAILLTLVLACGEKKAALPEPEASGASAAAAAQPSPSSAIRVNATSTLPAGDDLLSANRGVAVVIRPSEYSEGWAAAGILDGDPKTGWASTNGQTKNQVMVIESPEQIRLDAMVFDTRKIDGDGRGAREVTIETSNQSRSTGFTMVGTVTLPDRSEQAFTLANSSAGRWIRLTVLDNNGAADYSEIMEVRGYGETLSHFLDQPSLTSFSSGATVAIRPSEYSRSWSALLMLDGNPRTGWASEKGVVGNQTTVISLATRSELTHLVFDTAGIDGQGRGANHVTVEVSDTSPTDGYQQIASVALDPRRDNQLFAVARPVPGRWVRIRVADNHGASDYVELMEVRAVGRQLEPLAASNISGTYQTEYGAMHLRQEGTSVTGCYETSAGRITGGLEGRVMTAEWRQSNGSGPAVMVFSPDGTRLNGLWWRAEGTDSAPGFWDGKKTSDEIGGCAHWSGGAKNQLAEDLQKSGHAVVYGINFDVDSDTIRGESKPTLDRIVEVLREHPDWALTIEGHTDSTGNPEHNQDLSTRRAASVRSYLIGAGIDGTHLSTEGFGASRPVATNDTILGRAQNRRVELKRAG